MSRAVGLAVVLSAALLSPLASRSAVDEPPAGLDERVQAFLDDAAHR